MLLVCDSRTLRSRDDWRKVSFTRAQKQIDKGKIPVLPCIRSPVSSECQRLSDSWEGIRSTSVLNLANYALGMTSASLTVTLCLSCDLESHIAY